MKTSNERSPPVLNHNNDGPSNLQNVLRRFCEPVTDDASLWAALFDHIRPKSAKKYDQAAESLASLTLLFNDSPTLRQDVANSLLRLIQNTKHVSMFVSSGLLPSTGFFSEARRRISHRLLPGLIDTSHLRDLLGVIFHRRSDELWVNEIPDQVWIEFLSTLFDDNVPRTGNADKTAPHTVRELIGALRILSYRIASLGLDPELVHVSPDLEEHESPFLAQNTELAAYLAQYQTWWNAHEPSTGPDDQHLMVLLEQCREVEQRVHRRAARLGTSLALSFKLERLTQHLDRITALLEILGALRVKRTVSAVLPRIVSLVKELVRAECRKDNLLDHVRTNVELLSLRITDNAGRTGEHYITSGRSDYIAMLRSAAGAGFIIAFMAALKIILGQQSLAPLNEIIAICLNYSIGFVVIHMAHFTVATKQPAMTASAIAAAIDDKGGKTRNLDNLAELIVRTLRSQFAAVVGNVSVAIPMAMLIGIAVYVNSGEHFVGPDQSVYLLDSLNPVFSGALIYAAIAGVCLFLSGLVAGYYDNVCVYNRLPQRLEQLRLLRRLLGDTRLKRFTDYIENNLGALAGNFAFGIMLGGTWGLGMLLGLPLDIRHVTFSSAHVGFAVVGFNFLPELSMLVMAVIGVALIGVINLIVSFSLALLVALRARRVTFAQKRALVRLVLGRFVSTPRDFFLPPRATQQTPS